MPSPVAKVVKISDLSAHPLQAEIYHDCSSAEDLALKEDLRANGQRDPVVVVRNRGTEGHRLQILDGHRRVAFLSALGTKTVDAIIRRDLDNATDAQIAAEFLRFNSVRRQLGPVERTRVLRAQLLLEKKKTSFDNHLRSILTSRVRQALGLSLKSASRYVAVVEAPVEIQRAVEAGRLRLTFATRISQLSRSRQAEIAQAVHAEKEKSVNPLVSEMLALDETRHAKSVDAFASLVRSLRRAEVDLRGRWGNIPSKQIRAEGALLNHFAEEFDALLQRGPELEAVSSDTFERDSA